MAGLAIAGTAKAEATCASRAEMLANLENKHGEAVVAMGLTLDGYVLEVWLQPVSRRWTVTQTDTNGVTCAMTAGEGWEGAIIKPRGEPL